MFSFCYKVPDAELQKRVVYLCPVIATAIRHVNLPYRVQAGKGDFIGAEPDHRTVLQMEFMDKRTAASNKLLQLQPDAGNC